MSHWLRSGTIRAVTVVALAAAPAAIVAIPAPGVANADVCASAGRRVSVSGCANLADPLRRTFRRRRTTLRCRTSTRRPKHERMCGYNGRWVNASRCN